MRFAKYHALGNDYIVIPSPELLRELDPHRVRLICDRHYGIGSDGVLIGPLDSRSCDFRLRILNPDGSEAEKSGNGLRIFARFLWDEGLVGSRPFTLETAGGAAVCEVRADGETVQVELGEVRIDGAATTPASDPRNLLIEEMEVDGCLLRFCAATVGNPHCVVLSDDPTPAQARRFGPLIEVAPRFPGRTNVQFMKALDRSNIRIEIWERGAGYTLASGTSSAAAAAIAHTLGLCGPDLMVHMPGGRLRVQFRDGLVAILTGPVTKICDGVLAAEMFGPPR